jgi:hypothetical protein
LNISELALFVGGLVLLSGGAEMLFTEEDAEEAQRSN